MKCPYCGSENTFEYFRAEMPNILSACPQSMLRYLKIIPMACELCRDCMLGFNSSRLNEEQLKAIYDNYLYISPCAGIGTSKYDGMIDTMKRYYSIEDRILEIGCSEGYLMKKLKDVGYGHLSGIEPGPQAEQAGRNGLDIVRGYFNNSSFYGETFDGIYLMHVFEHFDNPFMIMDAMRNILSPDGEIIIEVPYFSGYHHQHLFFYNLLFLKRLCRDKNLKIVESRIDMDALRVVIVHGRNSAFKEVDDEEKREDVLDLAYTISKKFREDVEKVKSLMRNHAGKRVLWWGAGSLSVIYLNQLDKKLIDATDIYVVDSDKNKHGYCIPGVGIEVRSLGSIDTHQFDEIIIASSFYREIRDVILASGIRSGSMDAI